MMPKHVPWQRLPAVALALTIALAGRLNSQQADTLGLSAPDTARAEPSEAYVPGPELSPSTDHLFFEGLLPGESRTLFMDLANLGDGVIILDSLTFPAEIVRVTLPLQSLRPGQFVRFPVTYTQADLDTHDLEVWVHWNSPRYGVAEDLILSLNATPEPPLRAAPADVAWPEGYAGSVSSARVLLQNVGTFPITFPFKLVLPPEVQLSPLPPVIAGEATAELTVSWLPAAAGQLRTPVNIPYRIGAVKGRVAVNLQGAARQPAYFLEDTLSFGTVFAGSSYRWRVAVGNGSGQAMLLRRRLVSVEEEGLDVGRGVAPVEWIETPTELQVEPGDTAYLEVVFSPRRAGPYQVVIPFSQQLKPEPGRQPKQLPDLVLTVRAEVDLPLSASTTHVDFGPRPVLETAMRSLEVMNRGAAEVSISMELAAARKVFSCPPLVFSVAPGDTLELPLYFRPVDMQRYEGLAVLQYTTFGEAHEMRVTLEGRGLDRPLLRLDTIPDVTLEEDFPGRHQVADLTRIFSDANHAVSFRVFHPFGRSVHLAVEPGGRLTVAGTPDYHGAGEVVVEGVNELGHVVVDTFLLSITSVNDLLHLAVSIPDLVLKEDPAPVIVGKLSEIFVDPDRALDTVMTYYAIYTPATDDAVRLEKRGDELVLTVVPNWYGSRSFVVAARDARDTNVVVFDAFKVTVVGENDPPSISPLPGIELVEDEAVRLNWGAYIHDVDHRPEELVLSFTAADRGSLPLAFASVGGLATVVRPRADWSGELAARLTVTDPAGGSASRDFVVSVLAENDPPGPFKLIEPACLEWEQRLQYSGRDTLVTFKWEPSSNLDPGDDLFYTWRLLDTTGQRVLEELPAGLATEVTAHLDSAGIFLWAVIVRDREGAVTASDTLLLILEFTGPATLEGEEELAFSFGPNYPNPFSDHTRIEYAIPRYSNVVITVYDAMGRKVRVLHSEPQYRGRYVTFWDGRDSQGQRVASGPYVAEIRAGVNTAHLKLVVVH